MAQFGDQAGLLELGYCTEYLADHFRRGRRIGEMRDVFGGMAIGTLAQPKGCWEDQGGTYRR
jgi:hypothetical protein